VGGDHLAEARRDLVQGLVPGDAREAPLALAPHALQRVQQAVGAVHAVEVLVHLGAEEALGEAVVGVAAEGHRPPVLHVHGHDAGVRAVVGAGHLEAAARRSEGFGAHDPIMVSDGGGAAEAPGRWLRAAQ
jgi:hypothetical protein